MAYQPKHRSRSDGLSPTDITLLKSPLEFIAIDHLRMRAMCAEMDRLTQLSGITDTERDRVLTFLDEELPVLLSDESDDLFPMVLSRAEPEDELPKLERRLAREHRLAMERLPQVRAAFSALEPGDTIDPGQFAAVQGFTNHLRRHLILENAVMIPLAKARLTEVDLAELSLRMLRRRGLDRLFTDP